jgi:HAE1 family hydrophobic/amphiphilic exporter-1
LILTGGTQTVEVDIFGPDLPTLSTLAGEVINRVHTIPGYTSVDVNWQEAMPEVDWIPDRDKEALLGLDFSDVAETIDTATNGTLASYYQEEGFSYPIYVQMPEWARKTLPQMQRLIVTSDVPGSTSNGVTLGEIATSHYGIGPSEITRQTLQRYIAVIGYPLGRSAGQIQRDVQNAMAGFHLPTGYYWAWGISQIRRAQEFSGLTLAVVLAIGLIYMLLATQFESFIHPLTILFSVPLAAVGVILAMFLTGRSFGLTAFIGILMLIGIVVKNGILLVDYTNRLRQGGMERNEAVVTAGATRMRPILMTACAAILGMMPLALGIGRGSEIQVPMATAVVGGLATSTFLTLFIVPTVYTVMDDIVERVRNRRNGR